MAAGLQQGMIEAVPAPPLVAFALMWYTSTPYMLDLGLAPLTGATVVTKKTWNNVPETDRPKLLDAALKAQKRLRSEVPGQDVGAITEMTKKGLKVIKADCRRRRASGGSKRRNSRRACGEASCPRTSSMPRSGNATAIENSILPGAVK